VSIFEAIRQRPAMYLEPVSVYALRTFLLGFELGHAACGRDEPSPFALPRDFHDWVAYRLQIQGDSGGWAQSLAEKLGDGQGAVRRFFTLLDEHRERVPRTVAILSNCFQENTVYYGGQVFTNRYPSEIRLIAYNREDPGLFLVADDDLWTEQHSVNFEWFKLHGPHRYDLEVLDQEAFDRWTAFREEGK